MRSQPHTVHLHRPLTTMPDQCHAMSCHAMPPSCIPCLRWYDVRSVRYVRCVPGVSLFAVALNLHQTPGQHTSKHKSAADMRRASQHLQNPYSRQSLPLANHFFPSIFSLFWLKATLPAFTDLYHVMPCSNACSETAAISPCRAYHASRQSPLKKPPTTSQRQHVYK